MNSQSEITRALALIRDAVRTIKMQCPQDADLIVYQITHVALYNPTSLDTFLTSSVVRPKVTDKHSTAGPTEPHAKTPPHPERLPEHPRSAYLLSTADTFGLQGSQRKIQHNSSPLLKRKHGGGGDGLEECRSLPGSGFHPGPNVIEMTPSKRRARRNAQEP